MQLFASITKTASDKNIKKYIKIQNITKILKRELIIYII